MIRRISSLFMGLLLSAIVVPWAVWAQEPAVQEPRRINPDEAVSLAIKNNLGLESARVTADGKKRKSGLSWNQFIPSVTLGGSLVRDNEAAKGTVIPLPANMGGPVTLGGGTPQWHVAGSIQASLTINAAMFESMRRLRIDYEGGLISYDKAKAQLERDVRKAYYNMLLLQEKIALLRENFSTSQRRVETAQANYNAGLAPELALLQARVSMENMKPTIDEAENGLKLSMAQFAMNLGLSYDSRFELIPLNQALVFIPLDTAELISKAASGKPDILELKQNILLLQSARQAQILSLTPSLSLSWNTSPAFTGDPWKDDWGNGDLWQKSGSLTITLGLRVHSLIPFSTDFQAIKDLDDNIRTANIGLAQMIHGTEVEIYNTVLSLEKTQITADAQQQTIKLAEQSYKLTDEAYHAGLQDLLEVQNAELSLRQARVQMLEQQFNYLNGLIDLEYAIGVPFGTLSSKGSE
jgi:outer membrane protein TolC